MNEISRAQRTCGHCSSILNSSCNVAMKDRIFDPFSERRRSASKSTFQIRKARAHVPPKLRAGNQSSWIPTTFGHNPQSRKTSLFCTSKGVVKFESFEPTLACEANSLKICVTELSIN